MQDEEPFLQPAEDGNNLTPHIKLKLNTVIDPPTIPGLSASHLGSGTFNHLSLVQTDAPPLHGHQGAGNGHVALLVAESAPVFAVTVRNVDVVEL